MPRPYDALAWRAPLLALSPPHHASVAPEPLPAPYLVAFNEAAAPLVDLDPGAGQETGFVEAVAGARPWPGATPLAMRYAGHQFGVYVPQLGDGRALVLGEVAGADGGWREVALKGSGRTPFSRGGDGRAVLRSTIREYLGGEAMHGLGVPTTRALAIVGSDHPVVRERVETAAVLVRLAASHVRFGSFELFAHIDRPAQVRELADHVMAAHLPHLPAGDYPGFLREVVARTARTAAAWQAVGFTHGVMNTDNMSILGLTLDYGPYAFMEAFAFDHVPNHTDAGGRYAYQRQPTVALWNLGCLAYALGSLVPAEAARAALATYAPIYAEAYGERFGAKLGLLAWRGADDEALLAGLLRVMARQRLDYPRTFRLLGEWPAPAARDTLLSACRAPGELAAWLEAYGERLAEDGQPAEARREAMRRANPKYVLRTHLAQRAIERAERKDFGEIARLLGLLRDPFAEHPAHDADAHPAPADAPPVLLSCSS